MSKSKGTLAKYKPSMNYLSWSCSKHSIFIMWLCIQFDHLYISLWNCCTILRTHFHPHLQMVSLYRDPKGETIFRPVTSQINPDPSQSFSRSGSVQETVRTLRRRIAELEATQSQNNQVWECPSCMYVADHSSILPSISYDVLEDFIHFVLISAFPPFLVPDLAHLPHWDPDRLFPIHWRGESSKGIFCPCLSGSLNQQLQCQLPYDIFNWWHNVATTLPGPLQCLLTHILLYGSLLDFYVYYFGTPDKLLWNAEQHKLPTHGILVPMQVFIAYSIHA